MKKLLVVLGILIGASNAHAWVGNHELRSQFRLWKSSDLQGGDYSGVQIATSPIIFFMVTGSGTINSGGTNNFTLLQSTGMTSMSSNASTKTIIRLNSDINAKDDIGTEHKILVTTHSYFNKTGIATIQYHWDYYTPNVQFNKYPND